MQIEYTRAFVEQLSEFCDAELPPEEMVVQAAILVRKEIDSLREELAMARAVKVDPSRGRVDELTKEVIDLFNRVNNKTYRHITYRENIRAILKANPKITIDHFSAVIQHKHDKWGQDPKMMDYNRPATLFQSARKFMAYLDDAIQYFREKETPSFINQ